MSRLEEALKRSGNGGLFGAASDVESAEAEARSGGAPHPDVQPDVEPAAEVPARSRADGRPGVTAEAVSESSSAPEAEITTAAGPVATAAGVAEKVVVDAETN